MRGTPPSNGSGSYPILVNYRGVNGRPSGTIDIDS
jgi:hypothetical protein